MKNEFTLIGKSIPRPDAHAKVTGQARFADDYTFPDQLFGVMVRLPVAHAKINKIAYSAIESDPATLS